MRDWAQDCDYLSTEDRKFHMSNGDAPRVEPKPPRGRRRSTGITTGLFRRDMRREFCFRHLPYWDRPARYGFLELFVPGNHGRDGIGSNP